MSADKISAPYAIFYTKLGKNLQKFFHWRTLRKSPARSHNKRFFLVSHCGVGGNLQSKPPKGRSPSMEARPAGPLNGNPHCGVGGNLRSKPPKGRSPSMEARTTGPLNGNPHCGVGGNLRSKPPKGRSPSMEARTTGRQNLRIILHCGRWLLFLSRLNYAA